MNHSPKTKSKTLKLLEENTIEKNFYDMRISKIFLGYKQYEM